jgi:hypothetical protein
MISLYFNDFIPKMGHLPNNAYKLAASYWLWSPELNVQE